MRNIGRLAYGLVFLNYSMPAFAADGAGQDGNSSPLVWVLLFLPSLFIVLIFLFVFRKNRAMTTNSLKRFDEHRTFTEAHMRRLEAQLENLDKRLLRMIELLEAVERGQRGERG
jgi:hypothetical protein